MNNRTEELQNIGLTEHRNNWTLEVQIIATTNQMKYRIIFQSEATSFCI